MPAGETEHSQQAAQRDKIPSGSAEAHNYIKNVIAIMSGKGGVGKSFVTGLLASGLVKAGFKVGILDADITGPSIPKLFGLHGPVNVGEFGILPLESLTGVRVMSMNLLLPEEDKPVIWRGPLVSRAILQLWKDVMWGDLDFLLIDLPPGTSDATLTIMQSLPVCGLIMVTTPQSLASLVVRKAVNMAQIVKVNILGIIENMSYFISPESGEKIQIFGESHSQEVADAAGAPILYHLPIDPGFSRLCDAGEVEAIKLKGMESIVDMVIQSLPEGYEQNLRSQPETGINADVSVKPDGKLPNVPQKIQDDEENLAEFSETAQQIISKRENYGEFPNPDKRHSVRGCCGDSIQIDLLFDGETIQDAKYITDGCYATMACGGMLMRMIKGKTLEEAQSIKPEELIQALRGLPKGHVHCTDLSVKTLRETLHQISKRKEH